MSCWEKLGCAAFKWNDVKIWQTKPLKKINLSTSNAVRDSVSPATTDSAHLQPAHTVCKTIPWGFCSVKVRESAASSQAETMSKRSSHYSLTTDSKNVKLIQLVVFCFFIFHIMEEFHSDSQATCHNTSPFSCNSICFLIRHHILWFAVTIFC